MMSPRIPLATPSIVEEVDLNQPPIVDPNVLAREEAQVNLGDLHANAQKLFYTLKCFDFYETPDEDYITFVTIYNKPVDQLTADDITLFNTILARMQFNPAASTSLLRLLGDELADRGSNDYFVLKLIEKMALDNVQFTIILSNHSFNFYKAWEAFEKFSAPSMPSESKSIDNLQCLIDKNLVSLNEINHIYENIYLPHLKVIDYSINEDNSLTIYTHAPSGRKFIRDLIEDINQLHGETVIIYQDDTPQQLMETIDQINEIAGVLARKRRLSKLYYAGKNKALQNILWNRDYNLELVGWDPNDNYMNGHDLGFYIRNALMNQEWNNICSLDNRCGFTNIYETYQIDKHNKDERYTVVYSNKYKQHVRGKFYTETIGEVKSNIISLLGSLPIDASQFVLPESENILLYQKIYRLILLLKLSHLEEHLLPILSNINLVNDVDKLTLFNQYLVGLKHAGSLDEDHIKEIISMDSDNLKEQTIFWSLKNLLRVLQPNIDTDTVFEEIDFLDLHEVFKQCNAFGILNKEMYDYILSNINMINEMDVDGFIEHLVNKNIIIKTLKSTFELDLTDQEIKSLIDLYKPFSNEDLLIINNFFLLCHQNIDENKMNNDFFEDIYSNNYYLKNILIICQLFRENLDNTFDSIFNRSHCLTILDWFSLCNCLVNISDQNKIIILQHGIHLDEIQFLNETLLNFITDHPTPNIVIQLIMTLVHKEGILANNSDDFIRAVTNLNLTKEDNVDDVAFEKLITVLITQLKPEEKTNIISDTPTNLSSQSVSQATIFSPHADKKRKETLAGGPETKKRRVDKGK